jgi:hypothetical protein
MADRLDIMSRYQVLSINELESKVADGTIAEHPGWEDLMTIENLQNTIDKMKMELSHVRGMSTS